MRRSLDGDAVDLSFGGVATRASVPAPVDLVRARPETLGICHPEWRGIRAATYGQVQHVLEVPGIVSRRHLARLVALLEDCDVRRLVINGFPPDIPTWGRILYDSKDYLDIAPHWALFPGTAIFLAVLTINTIGDGLRDALDPRKVV